MKGSSQILSQYIENEEIRRRIEEEREIEEREIELLETQNLTADYDTTLYF